MWGFSAKWVLKCLKGDQKLQRCHSCEKHLEFFQSDPNDFLSDAISDHGKKAGYISMTRRQSNNQWSGGISSHLIPKKIQSAKIRWKSSCLDFWGSRWHPPHWLSSKGPSNLRGCYSFSVVQLKDILREKRCGKFKKVVFFLHDNAPGHQALVTQN